MLVSVTDPPAIYDETGCCSFYQLKVIFVETIGHLHYDDNVI